MNGTVDLQVFKKILIENFVFDIDRYDSLVNGALIDQGFLLGHVDVKALEHRKPYCLNYEFIKSHFADGQFIEPFDTWQAIPKWYIEDYSFWGLGQTGQQKIVFYLPRVILLDLEDDFYNGSAASEAWRFYLYPNVEQYRKALKPYNKSFFYDLLNETQKSIVAFYLSYNLKNGRFEMTEDIIQDEDSYWKYWHPYLKHFNHVLKTFIK